MRVAFSRIDYWAASGQSVWHRTSAWAKLVLAAAVLGSAIYSRSPLYLGLLYLSLWGLVAWSRLPLHRLWWFSLYPALFIVLFVVSRWDGTWTTPAVYFLRAVNAGMVAIWLVGTTPYPDLFAPLSRVTPRLLGDALFLAYRAFFILIWKLVHLEGALRLRGAFARGGLRRALENLGEGLGTLVLFSVERSQRVYAVMMLRGHSGRVCGCRHWATAQRLDALPLVLSAAVVAAALWAERGLR